LVNKDERYSSTKSLRVSHNGKKLAKTEEECKFCFGLIFLAADAEQFQQSYNGDLLCQQLTLIEK